MLPKTYRLKNKSAFNATYRLHNIIATKYLLAYVGEQKDDLTQQTKIGFVVSKKIHKRAVVRNRIKRLLREIIRLEIKNNNLKIETLKSLILVARPLATELDIQLAKNSIDKIMEKI